MTIKLFKTRIWASNKTKPYSAKFINCVYLGICTFLFALYKGMKFTKSKCHNLKRRRQILRNLKSYLFNEINQLIFKQLFARCFRMKKDTKAYCLGISISINAKTHISSDPLFSDVYQITKFQNYENKVWTGIVGNGEFTFFKRNYQAVFQYFLFSLGKLN